MPTFTTLIQPNIGSPSHSKQTRRRNKGIQIGKEGVILSLFTDDMILYIETPKDSIKKLLDLTNEFNNIAGYKIHIPISIAFLYTNSANPIYHCNKKLRYLGIKTKKVKDLYSKSHRTLNKEIEEDMNRWENISCL
uniref:Reverse transcriptase domain-containing protein n=1 Tax=Myotis myotis TaxID=51298 RepID=A0A7J7ZY43_MYOMY|nr:hypothetical protein mMyoMyo1_009845 [Myotis myotis]